MSFEEMIAIFYYDIMVQKIGCSWKVYKGCVFVIQNVLMKWAGG